MAGRGGEEKGKRELGCGESIGFVLEFLQGMALERALLGLFSGFLDKVQASGMLGCFGAQVTSSFFRDRHTMTRCPLGLWLSHTPHPPAKQKPLDFPIPCLSTLLALKNLAEMLLDLGVVVQDSNLLSSPLSTFRKLK